MSPEGYLYAETTFARDGILEYVRADGTKRRELRLPEENKKALVGFGRKPVTVEHPTVLVSSNNAKELGVGLTDPEVVYDKSGFVKGVITVTDSSAVELIRSGEKPEVSVGYQCRIENTPGVWKGQKYDAIQRDIVVNHVCCTKKGRAGADVRIHLDSDRGDGDYDIAYLADSLDNQQKGGNVASLTIDSATYDDIPSDVASVVSDKLQRLDALLKENEGLKESLGSESTRLDSANQELADAIKRAEEAEGRCDRYEEILEEGIPLLSEQGYTWNADSSEFDLDEAVREDMAAKKDMKKEDMEMEDEDEEMSKSKKDMGSYKKGDGALYKKGDMGKKIDKDMEEDDEEMEDEESIPNSLKKKDSIADITDALLEAQQYVPGLRADSIGEEFSVADVKRAVLSHLDSELDLTGASDGYVAGVYHAMTEGAQGRNDSQDFEEGSYLSPQDAMTAISMPAYKADSEGSSMDRISEAWKQPLS